jgi:hypothetical protein
MSVHVQNRRVYRRHAVPWWQLRRWTYSAALYRDGAHTTRPLFGGWYWTERGARRAMQVAVEAITGRAT